MQKSLATTILLTSIGIDGLAYCDVTSFSHPSAASETSTPANTSTQNTERDNGSSLENTQETAAPTVAQTAYVTFTLNIQDFSYPEKTAKLLTTLIREHESRNIPVEIYLTTTMVDILSTSYPDA